MKKAKTFLLVILILLTTLITTEVFSEPFKKEEAEIAGILMGRIPGKNTKVFLPLKKTNVKIEMTGTIIKAEVTQVFTNDTEYPLEAVYVFPLPSKSTICDMEMKIGERIIKSIVQEREEAKRTYEKAKQEGRKAALLEEERPNIFTTSVANFLPGETVEIKLSYFENADFKKGKISMTFPMVVGQRYVPFEIKEEDENGEKFTTEVEEWQRINPPLVRHPNIDPGHRLSIEMEINGIPVKHITSSTHNIGFENVYGTEDKVRVFLNEEVTIPDCDFAIDIHLVKDTTPTFTCVNSFNDNNSHGILTIFPPIKKIESKESYRPREVVFLIDTSGSMTGTSIVQAKKGLKHCLKMLRPKDTFTIVRFANNYSYFSKKPIQATPSNIRKAKGYIDGLTAGGGTEMQKALIFVLGMLNRNQSYSEKIKDHFGSGGGRHSDYPEIIERIKMIIFLTDGCVGNENSLIRLLSSRLHKTRLFTFGIGSAPNEYIMRKMAEIGRGQSRFIHSEEDIGVVMSDFFKTLKAPVLTDIEIIWKDALGTKLKNIKFFPNPCPDVFYERPLRVIAEYPSDFNGSVVVKGVLDGEWVEYEYEFSESNKMNYRAIDKFFGKAKINDLMAKLVRTRAYLDRMNIEKEITKVALEHQLVSKYTSRIAVEEIISRDPNGLLVSVKVPVKLPRGWDKNYWYPTATDDYLKALIGIFLIFIAVMINLLRKKLEKGKTNA